MGVLYLSGLGTAARGRTLQQLQGNIRFLLGAIGDLRARIQGNGTFYNPNMIWSLDRSVQAINRAPEWRNQPNYMDRYFDIGFMSVPTDDLIAALGQLFPARRNARINRQPMLRVLDRWTAQLRRYL